jgi:hypothetical protein
MKTIELTHDEVCHALIQYIERDKNEHVIGTPTLCVMSDNDGNLRTCSLVLDDYNDSPLQSSQEVAQQVGKEIHKMFAETIQEIKKESNKLDEDTLKNYDSRDGRWLKDYYH